MNSIGILRTFGEILGILEHVHWIQSHDISKKVREMFDRGKLERYCLGKLRKYLFKDLCINIENEAKMSIKYLDPQIELLHKTITTTCLTFGSRGGGEGR